MQHAGGVAPILVLSGPSGAGKTTVGRLVADGRASSAHVQIDAFMPFVVSGWVDPWLPEAAHQNEILGGAAASAAIQLAEGGYTVVLDGCVFPAGMEGMGRMCGRRGVALSYAVLRPDLATCLARASRRPPSGPAARSSFDPELLAEQHARFADHERHVVDGSGTAEEVAARVAAAFTSARLVVPPRA